MIGSKNQSEMGNACSALPVMTGFKLWEEYRSVIWQYCRPSLNRVNGTIAGVVVITAITISVLVIDKVIELASIGSEGKSNKEFN